MESVSALSLDTDGDGTPNHVIAPQLNGEAGLDTTPPEFRIGFSTTTQMLTIDAYDASSTVTMQSTTTYPILKPKQKEYRGIATTTVSATDAAGNTTVLTYTEKLPKNERRIRIALHSIAYNGATTTLGTTTLSYKWKLTASSSYQMLAAHVATPAAAVESHYRPKKNMTVIMTRPKDLDEGEVDTEVDIRAQREKLPGIYIPIVETHRGNLLVE
jgi:hypothetical protein